MRRDNVSSCLSLLPCFIQFFLLFVSSASFYKFLIFFLPLLLPFTSILCFFSHPFLVVAGPVGSQCHTAWWAAGLGTWPVWWHPAARPRRNWAGGRRGTCSRCVSMRRMYQWVWEYKDDLSIWEWRDFLRVCVKSASGDVIRKSLKKKVLNWGFGISVSMKCMGVCERWII